MVTPRAREKGTCAKAGTNQGQDLWLWQFMALMSLNFAPSSASGCLSVYPGVWFSLLFHGGSGFLSAKACAALWVCEPTAEASTETTPCGTHRSWRYLWSQRRRSLGHQLYIKKSQRWDFPSGPVVETLCFQCLLHSLVGELRSHMPCGKKKKKMEVPRQAGSPLPLGPQEPPQNIISHHF